MSRYVVRKNPEIVVGWDDPLATFFVHTYSADGELVVMEGTTLEEIVTLIDVEKLVTQAGGALTQEVVAALCEDFAAHVEWRPGPPQEALGFTGRQT